MATVTVISPDGKVGDIPQENLADAVSQGGFKPAVAVTDPQGREGWLTHDQVGEAVTKGGFTVGHTPTSMPTPWQAAMSGVGKSLDTTGQGLVAGAKGIATSLNPVPQNTVEKIGAVVGAPAPLTRLVTGVLEGLTGVKQVPAAVKDIAADPDRINTISDQVNRSASEALPNLLAGRFVENVAEGYKGKPQASSAAPIQAKAAVKINPTLDEVKAMLDKGKPAPPAQGSLPLLMGDTIGPEQPEPAGLSREIQPTKQGELPLTMGHEEGAAPKTSVPEKSTTVPKTETAGTKVGSDEDTAFFKQAKESLPADTPIGKVAGKAQELKQQSADFEKTFGQPLKSFKNADGTFDMRDFLQSVVKPGERPVPEMVSRQFGVDGVNLLHEITGEPLHKWAEFEPTATAKLGAAKQANVLTPSVSGGSGAPSPKIAAGSPQQYLKMIGADQESSILKTPKDVQTVNFMRKQIREGKPIPGGNPELHMDENNNIVGGDGRHRALAYAKEGVQKIKINVIRHPFEKSK